jgi:hypothetical protein
MQPRGAGSAPLRIRTLSPMHYSAWDGVRRTELILQPERASGFLTLNQR